VQSGPRLATWRLDEACDARRESAPFDSWFEVVLRSQSKDKASTRTRGVFPSVRLMGAKFASITESEAVNAIVDAAEAGRGHWTITANLDHIRRYRKDDVAKRLIDRADLVVADGTSLIWASRVAGSPLPERVAGSTMVWSICREASEREQSIFLLGGSPGVAERASRILTEHYPALKIIGTLCPHVDFDRESRDLERLYQRVAVDAPRIVLVALGFPKQDILIDKLRDIMPSSSFVGVGISLSFVAGEISRAPRWIQAIGLEWIYRLIQEPRRLFRRYLIHGIPFAVTIIASAIRWRVPQGRAELLWGADLSHDA
jgi:N-acetylglucosaminyldiphosphoundecaprenol N-acetyl-beta-D-mannosaminyltransferase